MYIRDELGLGVGLKVLDEVVELLVDGREPHLNLTFVLHVLLGVDVVVVHSPGHLVVGPVVGVDGAALPD